MLRMIRIVCAAAAMSLLVPIPVCAQSSAADMLEQARARSREIEEMKTVLNGPDQNMRLAVFDVMVNSGDEAMRQIALDAGLASTDPLLQGMAFKETILSLKRIVFDLEIDKSQPDAVQQKAQAYVNSKGSTYEFPITTADKETGTFTIKTKASGQVNGTVLTFKDGYHTGQLELADETAMKGPITLYHQGGYGVFRATARMR